MEPEIKQSVLDRIDRILTRGGRAEVVRIKGEVKVFEIKRREEKR